MEQFDSDHQAAIDAARGAGADAQENQAAAWFHPDWNQATTWSSTARRISGFSSAAGST